MSGIAKDSYVLGTHALFFRENDAFTVPNAGTCGRSSKPGATDPAWIDLGVIEEATDDPIQEEEFPIFAPGPGILRKYRNLGSKVTQKGEMTLKEVSALALEILYRTAALSSASTQANRHAGVKKVGWLKRQIYDHTDTQFLVEDVFVELKVKSAVKVGGGLAEVQIEYEVLYSAYNTIGLGA